MNERSFDNQKVAKRVDGSRRGEYPALDMNERSFGTRKTSSRRKPAAPRPRRRAAAISVDIEHRDRILKAAEDLFSKQGFHGTGLREIADAAQVSLGNIYNHFATKEKLYRALMESLEARYLDPSQPLPSALMEVDFPEDLDRLGEAARETVRRFASYIRLIYVDVIEFRGAHVARMYGGMKERYTAVFADRLRAKKRKGVLGEADPVIGAMMVTTLFMYYFTVEHLFGVHRHYGLDDARVIAEFARVFKLGLLRR
jgi:AcrR family transcriptional regulator